MLFIKAAKFYNAIPSLCVDSNSGSNPNITAADHLTFEVYLGKLIYLGCGSAAEHVILS